MSLTEPKFAPVEETIHGVLVRDPYRWLEDRSLPETEEWIRQQQRRCDEYFEGLQDLPLVRERVRQHLDVEVVDQPAKIGNQYFFRRRAPGEQQGCIYVRDAVTDQERLLVDPSDGGPFVSVAIHRISKDGALLAYERKFGGGDKTSIHILDVQTGIVLDDGIESGYAHGFTFGSDDRGVFYCHEEFAGSKEHIVRRRRFDAREEDCVILNVPKACGSRLSLTADAIHLGAFWTREVDGELIGDFWLARQDDPLEWRKVCAGKKLPFSPILKNGRLFALSYEHAANGELLELSENGEEIGTIIHEQEWTFQQVLFVEDGALAVSQDGLTSSIWCCRGGDEPTKFNVLSHGTGWLLSDLGDGSAVFLSYESFIQPPTIFEYVPASDALTVWRERPTVRPAMSIEVQDAAYSSSDGSQIPITLIGRDVASRGQSSRTVIMTGYGGFGVSMTPQYSVLVSELLQCGAVFALPRIRGGGERGKAWHDAGRKTNKQTSFEDFLAAAEWLCREGVTTPSQLGIFGGSNSGLLVGAAMTQRPDLFCVVLCIAPLLDMVRYECFDQALRWRKEYGSCEKEDEFRALYGYSPYHRIRDDIEYPSVLFVSGDMDDRCNPAHVRKMAARLLERPSQTKPVLIDYSSERGHSPALPLSVRIDALARRVAFLLHELNLQFVD